MPDSLREAAYALGAPKWRVIVVVSYRAAFQGILTGVLWRSPASAARPRRSCSRRCPIPVLDDQHAVPHGNFAGCDI